jgi:hypothetical protein
MNIAEKTCCVDHLIGEYKCHSFPVFARLVFEKEVSTAASQLPSREVTALP